MAKDIVNPTTPDSQAVTFVVNDGLYIYPYERPYMGNEADLKFALPAGVAQKIRSINKTMENNLNLDSPRITIEIARKTFKPDQMTVAQAFERKQSPVNWIDAFGKSHTVNKITGNYRDLYDLHLAAPLNYDPPTDIATTSGDDLVTLSAPILSEQLGASVNVTEIGKLEARTATVINGLIDQGLYTSEQITRIYELKDAFFDQLVKPLPVRAATDGGAS